MRLAVNKFAFSTYDSSHVFSLGLEAIKLSTPSLKISVCKAAIVNVWKRALGMQQAEEARGMCASLMKERHNFLLQLKGIFLPRDERVC